MSYRSSHGVELYGAISRTFATQNTSSTSNSQRTCVSRLLENSWENNLLCCVSQYTCALLISSMPEEVGQRICWICHADESLPEDADPSLGELISPCDCKGSMKWSHEVCLARAQGEGA